MVYMEEGVQVGFAMISRTVEEECEITRSFLRFMKNRKTNDVTKKGEINNDLPSLWCWDIEG